VAAILVISVIASRLFPPRHDELAEAWARQLALSRNRFKQVRDASRIGENFVK
jgi:hypothetical protein